MMTFQLDTTGDVAGKTWPDLSPFTQGYIEALFAETRTLAWGEANWTAEKLLARLGWKYAPVTHDGYIRASLNEGDALWAASRFGVTSDEVFDAEGLASAEDAYARCALTFSDLAPETLARIIADCEASRHQGDKGRGAAFWRMRQRGDLDPTLDARFPPLTVQLGDDGKVRFA